MKPPVVALIGLMVAACGASPSVEHKAPGSDASPDAKPGPSGALLESYLSRAREAWESKDRARLADLYTKDARITEIGEAERKLGEVLDDMADGPLKVSFSRGLVNGQDAVVEWAYGGPYPGRDWIGARGASVLSFSADGRVSREIRYFDSSTLSAQMGAGWRYCLLFRPAVPDAIAAPTLHVGSEHDGDAAARAWLDPANGSKGTSSAVVVANMFLAADSAASNGMAEPLARAFQSASAAVSHCISSPDLVACEVERRGTFAAPLIGIRPTGRTGTTHWLEVAEVSGGKITAVTSYGNGREFVHAFVDLEASGFLSPTQVIDPDPCK